MNKNDKSKLHPAYKRLLLKTNKYVLKNAYTDDPSTTDDFETADAESLASTKLLNAISKLLIEVEDLEDRYRTYDDDEYKKL